MKFEAYNACASMIKIVANYDSRKFIDAILMRKMST